jgi:hypothetical protein
LHRRRCRFDDVLDDRRHRGGSVIRARRRLAYGEGDLVLELANALRKGLRLGLARRFAGRIFPRNDFRRTRVKDVGDANPLGRRDIADVDRSGRIDPRVDVCVSKRQPERARENCGQHWAENTGDHYRYPITITAIVGRHARVG